MAEWAKRNRLRMDPFSSRLLSTSIAVPPYIPGGRATTAVDEQGRIWQAPGPVVQTNHADDASNRSLGVTILASTTLKLAWKRVQWLVRCSVAGVVVTCRLLWAGMESEWSRLGNFLAHTGLLAHGWHAAGGPVTGSQRNSRGAAKAGFTLLENGASFCLESSKGPSQSSPRCGPRCGQGAPPAALASDRLR